MNAQTVGWLVFLAVIKNFSCGEENLFKLEATHLTAKEGSCIEIKCRVTLQVNAVGAYWFWIKDSQWNITDWTGTVIYSMNTTERPVSTDFADRVKYIGSLSSSRSGYLQTSQKCGILICDLKKTDNGNYSFRFVGKVKWMTKQVRLEVKENLCLITFEKPPVVNESDTINLTCSTLSLCPSSPKIGGLTQLSPTQQMNGKQNSTTVSFTVNWQDDGKEFSCQTDDTDNNLIRNISLTVEYAPKDTSAKISPENVVERQSVNLTCSAKGRPEPNFTWFKNKKEVIGTGAVWGITSITESQNGEYHCEAKNKQGTIESKPVNISVKYVPEVEVKSPSSIFIQGDTMTLTCNVKRSNPQPHTYDWLKDGKAVAQKQTHERYVVERIEPEDRGSYTCRATNTVGNGTSVPLKIEVKYGPRKTTISTSINDKSVGVGKSLTFNCKTDANPAPSRYSWYRLNNNNKQIDSSQWKSKTTTEKELRLDTVKRTDDACYRCNATNSINTGDDSELVCINVLYPPTKLTLSMDTEVREGQLIIIRCTVESLPRSILTFKRTSESNPQSSQPHVTHPYNDLSNTLQHAFNVTSTHTGFYTCDATNSEGSKTSERKKLVVNYCPKDVTVKAQPALVVNENKSLTLDCSARSCPPVTSVTWMKVTDGKSKILQRTQTFTLNSVSPSDSGLYSCEASNDIGTGNSNQTEVKVKYAPKHTRITTGAEHQKPDGTRSVTLSCSSQSYPQVTQYSWHKMKAERNEKVSDRQSYTVYSDKPGVYYCITKNEMGQRSSDPVSLFDRNVMKTLLIILFVIILLIIVSMVIVYRHKKKKLEQQGTTNTLPCFGFLGWWNGAGRRNRMSNLGMVEPFRSRDDLLPDQTHRPNAQRCQPRPDSTPASNINSVYSTVNLPSGQQGRPVQKIIRQQGGHTQDDSLNYAYLHFGNKQKNKILLPANVEDVYAKVSKKKPPTKIEDRPEDYENASAARAPNPIDYDTDTSEDEVQVNYSQVSFKAKPGHQRVVRDSSSSDEDETQYSEVKI
ncbi:B-cell receptor CD22 [Anarhichas minor]|uniref:B-cell receptor CD22 n=1 Tax=Anarhichas minor TaxID=65739 RepID=UPI003F73FCC0